MWPGCLFGGAAISLICCEAISYFLRTAAMVRLVLIVVIMVVVRMVVMMVVVRMDNGGVVGGEGWWKSGRKLRYVLGRSTLTA